MSLPDPSKLHLTDPRKLSRSEAPRDQSRPGQRVGEQESGSRQAPAVLPTLFGRDKEEGILLESLKSVAEGSIGAVILLSGESGVGKTALAEWSMAKGSADDLGFIVARSTCEPFHAGMSFFPIHEIDRRLSGNQTVQQLIASGYGPSSNEATVAVRAFDDNTEPGTRREYVMATFANAVVAAARSTGRPILIFVDDLERIDASSVDALTVLMSRLSEARVLMLGAYRSDLVAADPQHSIRPFVEHCRRDQKLVEVTSVSESFLRPMVESFLGDKADVSEHFLRRLYSETEGNPLYVREVLRSLRDDTASGGEPPLHRQADGSWTFDQASELWNIPQSIEDAIATRLTPLTPAQRDVLDEAGVIGRRCRYETLLALSGANEDALLMTLDQLVLLDLLAEVEGSEGELEFTHGKVREVVYGQMTGLRRTRLHAQVAEVLESQKDIFGPAEWEIAIGTHLLAARKYDAAAPHLLRAGETALGFQAGAEAAAYFRQCLDALEKSNSPDPRKLSDVRLLYGEALKAASQLDAATRELELVAGSSDSPSAQRWALNHLGDIFKMKDQISVAEDFYRRCESAALAAGDRRLLAEVSADSAELHMRQSERLAGRDPEAAAKHAAEYKRYLDLEIEYVKDSDIREDQARCYRNRAKYERTKGDPLEAIKLYEHSLQFTDAGVASHQFLIPYAKSLRLVGRSEDAMKQVHAVLDWSRQIGVPRSEAIARQYLGLLLMEDAIAKGGQERMRLLEQARAEMKIALRLHEETNFKQGHRETAVDLFELELLSEHPEAARHYLHLTDDYAHSVQPLDDEGITNAVLEQLRANGEGERAARISHTLTVLHSKVDPTKGPAESAQQ